MARQTSTLGGPTAPLLPLEEGWTLPASWYADTDVHELELRSIFERSWQYAGPAEQVAQPGSYLATRAAHVPVVVTRAEDGVLRAFVNVCRHRGHVVADGAGCRATLQCPYHAWTYGLDGSLRRAPRAERESGFDAATLGLRPISVDVWGPWVFVNPDRAAAPLADTLADLPDLLAECGLELAALRFHSHHEWDQAVNWKVALENYLECYHCAIAHPGFSKVIDVDPDAYVLRVEPTYSSQVGPVPPAALAGDGGAPYDARGEVTQSQYHFIWPNTTINVDPGPQNVSIERWVPAGPRLTVEVTDYWFGADVAEERAQEVIEFGTQVANEDVALCEAVQAGLDSQAVPQGRLMLASEGLIHDFQRRVAAALAG